MKDVQSVWRKLARDLKERDRALSALIAQIGEPELALQANSFRALIESILSQQLAPKASQTIIERFRLLQPPFPRPEFLLQVKPSRLRSAGVSPQKAGYLVALSEAWQNRRWRRGWGALEDEELVERLVEVKGIGLWTAHMFLIFSLGRPNVLPVGDYGVRRGLQLLYRLPELPSPIEVPEIVPHWKGGYSVGAWYLWRALDRKLLT